METKTLDAVITMKSANGDGPGEFEAILSMPTLDRDKEIIVAKALEPLPARISIDIDHGLTVSKTVGSGVPFYDGDVLKVKGTFASTPLGKEIRTLVTEGHIGHMSVVVAFAQKEQRDGVGYITKGELINATFTGIPANVDARVLSSKSFGDDLAVLVKNAVLAALDERAGSNQSPNTDTPVDTAAPQAAVEAGAEVDVARALVELALVEAALAL
jgi:hypothetical protein